MPIKQFATAVIETSLNVMIKDDPDLGRRLSRLKGNAIQVLVRELDMTLTFVLSQQQIDVLSQYEGQPDCYLSFKLTDLSELREQANITKLIKQDKLVLEGDAQLAQKFAQLITDCKPDIEEWLSRITGDVVAHTVVQGAKDFGSLLQTKAAKHQNHISQVLTEEWKVFPGALEVAHFCDQVDEVTSLSATIESRLSKLSEQV
ncbi:ubiquinone biosynthesis accessory factor UbiJ [Vibrio marisflavi]|uniref:Ubiquinone biosynthesis accessory factor UbiJ n=1 Tax=Vibrio marisflavi CECT 7928 TaxID=634439 RepID=A0ABN8E9J3_9VIBR|nr:SCP2 domain-containing protein [Vibrio marisflavi]CAH0542021.1 Ubiquinone biosynthesis accessory factor UbiJ [Vibrio marisflavi CECT 7928]